MGIVALANLYTCDLLLRQAYVAGKTNYEDLAYAVGGEPWLVSFLLPFLTRPNLFQAWIPVHCSCFLKS